MYSQIVEDLESLDSTRNQLNDNLGFVFNERNDEEEEQDEYDNNLDYQYNYSDDNEEGGNITNTDPIAQTLNLDYPLTTTHFKKNFEDSSLSADFPNTISPILTMSYNFKHSNTKLTKRSRSYNTASPYSFVANDILNLKDKQHDLSRDPLISSVAGSISSSSYSLDLSSDQLSPSSILSSIDLKSFSASQADLDKEITNDSDQRPALQSMASSSSFLMVNLPGTLTSKLPNENTATVATHNANYVKQPRQGRYSASRKVASNNVPSGPTAGNYTDTSAHDDLSVYSSSSSAVSSATTTAAASTAAVAAHIETDLMMNSAGPNIIDPNKKVSDSRLSAQGLAQVLQLDSPEEALKRERYILDIFENELHYPLGYKTWVRDTSKEYRIKLIDELYDRVKGKYPEYDRSVLETIIRRATYYMMQSRLRRERRAKAKGIRSSHSATSLS